MEPIKFYTPRRYRLHPIAEQAARHENWSNCLIALWEDGVCAVEQNRRLFRGMLAKHALLNHGNMPYLTGRHPQNANGASGSFKKMDLWEPATES